MKKNPSETLYIYLDERCNQNCVFCVAYEKGESRFGSMSTNDAKKTIKEFARHKRGTIVFSGGEPTIRNDLPEIIKYAGNFDNVESISIVTNGVRLVDKNYFGKLVKADQKNKMSFSLSLHSHKKKISELLTASNGTFDKTISGIENVIRSKKNASIYQVITSKNYKDIPEFCEYINRKYPQIKWIVFAYPFPQGRALLNDWIYVKISLLRPYLIKAFRFLEKKNYVIKVANCGQLPLCALPNFEEKVIDPRFFTQENVIGMTGQKDFQDFEYITDEWTIRNKGKNKKCQKCIFNKICQGLWKKYVDLFGLDGIHPVTEKNFKGNKVAGSLKNKTDTERIISNLIKNKLNLIKLTDYNNKYLKDLINFIKQNQAFSIIIYKGKALYP